MSPDTNGPEDRLCLANARASAPWQPVIEKILTHLGLQADCGRRSAPARGLAPQEGFALASANAACKAVHPLGRRSVVKRCKRSDDSDSSPFRWPAEQGYGDRLRARVFGTDGCGAALRANP